MWDWIGKAAELQAGRRPFALATVIRTDGSTPRESGAKMIVLPGGTAYGTVGGGHVERSVIAEAQDCLRRGLGRIVRCSLTPADGQLCGGKAEILVEVLHTGPEVYIFGAGHVGQALCRTLADTPFTIHLIDDREEWVRSEAVPGQVIAHSMPWKRFLKTAAFDKERTFVVIMTPSHRFDTAILQAVIDKPCRYLGMIGSSRKWKEVRAKLEKAGIPKRLLSRVACPIGLPVGGKTPKEIGISVASQMLQALNAG